MQALIIVIDSFGIGALPDAEKYGDGGANTALHICENIPGEKWKNLKKLGLGNCAEILGFSLPGCEAIKNPEASFGVMAEKSPGKDTTTGHWELAGIILEKPFTVFPQNNPSFPPELLKELTGQTGRKIIGNKAASGIAIIQELGPEHMKTGSIIAYTSADSVFQIAAHEGIVKIEELYEICEKARKLCDKYNVGRVIARPFIGEPGNFTRTANRRDFSIELPEKSLLEYLSENNIETIGIGKIGDIFNEKGISQSFHDKGNDDCLNRIEDVLCKKAAEDRFIFANLVDTDMKFGHRRDIKGYYESVENIDRRLPSILEKLDMGNLCIITADHGCDPAYKGSDHTREYVPLIAFHKGRPGKDVGIRESFSDAAKTIADYFKLSAEIRNGKSFL